MFEITFQAKSRADLEAQLRDFMGVDVATGPVAPDKEPKRPTQSRRAKAPEPEAPGTMDPVEETFDVDIPEEETVDAKAQAAVDLLKLKNEQLDRLRDLFTAGKGTFVRELLAKYGEGAKVFPEVEAKHFPAIKAEIDRELN